MKRIARQPPASTLPEIKTATAKFRPETSMPSIEPLSM
jgi:hypothetical protein